MDSKFDSLPWLDTNQKNIFESKSSVDLDLCKPSIDSSACVESFNINISEILKIFGSKVVSLENCDFSDNIKPTRRIGYTSGKERLDIYSDLKHWADTPFDQFQILRHEFDQLSRLDCAEISTEELQQVKDQLDEYEAQLNWLNDTRLGKGLPLSNTAGISRKNLTETVNQLKSQPAQLSTTASRSTGVDRCEIQFADNTEASLRAHQYKQKALDQRLASLEAVIGRDAGKLQAVSQEATTCGLLDAVHKLCAKSSLLVPNILDQVEVRLASVNSRMAEIAAAGKQKSCSSVDVATKYGPKLAELYELVKRLDPVAGTVPNTIERLISLRMIHDQVAHFSHTVSFLDKNCQAIDEELVENGHLLQKMDTNLRETGERVKSLQKIK